MPYLIVSGDITTMHVDAVVNAANRTLLGGGGVDGAIHSAAGPRLLEECRKLGGCETGEAKITCGYNLPAGYVIHTVGPVWYGGKKGEREKLASCYRNSLRIAKERYFDSIAFPLISTGAFGYPMQEALDVATETIKEFLEESDMTVYMVIFDRKGFNHSGIGDSDELSAFIRESQRQNDADADMAARRSSVLQSVMDICYSSPKVRSKPPECSCRFMSAAENEDIDDALSQLDMGFSEMLFKFIDEKGMTDAECYKAANIDRRHFAKIRADRHYHPKKQTCIAFAIALRLTLDETKKLLESAGYMLTHSSKADLIIEYYISKGVYDVFTINNTLFAYDLVLLGA